MLKLLTILLISVMFLSGCGGDISKVKDASFDLDSTYTNSQIFDNRNICKSIEWDKVSDNKGRVIVQHKCVFKGVDQYYTEQRDARMIHLNKILSDLETRRDEKIAGLIKEKEMMEALLQQPQMVVNPASAPSTWLNHSIAEDENAIATKKHLMNDAMLKSYQDSLERKKQNRAKEVAEYVRLETEKIENERNRILEKIASTPTQIQQVKDEYEENYNLNKKSFDKEMKAWQENIVNEPVAAYDTFSWSVKDENVELVSYEFVKEYANGKVERKSNTHAERVLSLAANDKVTKYGDYFLAIGF